MMRRDEGVLLIAVAKAICLHRYITEEHFGCWNFLALRLLGWLAYAVFDFSLFLLLSLCWKDVTTSSHLVSHQLQKLLQFLYMQIATVFSLCTPLHKTPSGRWKRLIWWIIHNSLSTLSKLAIILKQPFFYYNKQSFTIMLIDHFENKLAGFL